MKVTSIMKMAAYLVGMFFFISVIIVGTLINWQLAVVAIIINIACHPSLREFREGTKNFLKKIRNKQVKAIAIILAIVLLPVMMNASTVIMGETTNLGLPRFQVSMGNDFSKGNLSWYFFSNTNVAAEWAELYVGPTYKFNEWLKIGVAVGVQTVKDNPLRGNFCITVAKGNLFLFSTTEFLPKNWNKSWWNRTFLNYNPKPLHGFGIGFLFQRGLGIGPRIQLPTIAIGKLPPIVMWLASPKFKILIISVGIIVDK